MAEILAVGLGGTIAMRPGAHGLSPEAATGELLGGLADPARVETCDLALTASANLGWDHLLALRDRLRRHFREGGRAAVVLQGTDTLEETAFALELLGPGGPVVFTGAMRGADVPGADGPANLQAALRVAGAAPRDLGVVVAMDDRIHAARRVRKAHTVASGAFTSGEAGALGRVHEGRLRLFAAAPGPLPVLAVAGPPPPVAIATLAFGCGPEALAAARAPGVAGCVLQALGAGHAPAALVPELEALARAMPLVLCSRAGDGPVAERTYGYAGGERDLIERGAVPAGRLDAAKARILLQLCLAARADPRAVIREIVETIG